MKRRPIDTRDSARLRGRTAALLAVLFGLGIHILFTPFHLVHEDHLGVGVHGDTDAARTHGHDHAHHGGHAHHHGDEEPAPDDEGEHLPHLALDHASDFLARRSSLDDEVVQPLAPPPLSVPSALLAPVVRSAPPRAVPPRAEPPPRGPTSRAPPERS